MKFLSKIACSGMLVTVTLGMVLGKDYRPFMRTAQKSAAQKLLALVDQYELKIQQVHVKIEDYENRIVANSKQRFRVRSLLSDIDRRQSEATRQIANHRAKLESLQVRLINNDGTVFASTGEPMRSAEIQQTIDRSKRSIESNRHRAESHEKMSKSCQMVLQKLDVSCESGPEKIASLRSFAKDLRTKIAMAKEMQTLTDQVSSVVGETTSSEQIMESMVAIDRDIDAELAGLSTLLSIRAGADNIAVDESLDESLNVESFISQCQTALSSNTRF